MEQTKSGLEEYRRRRDFGRTSEPRGAKVAAGSRTRFVVQKHSARALHFDLRLEWRGVLLSWAVTKGPSRDPSVKRLAVRTEDHPIDYADFEGTIPKGQYGGGTVMIWDCGTWRPLEPVDHGLESGKLSFRLNGKRMKGGWALVRLPPAQRAKRENWLLIKERDEEAVDGDRDGDADIAADDDASIATGRSMQEIAGGRPRHRSHGNSGTKTKRGYTLPTPRFVPPELCRLQSVAPEGDNWLHETKFDGYRCLAALGKQGIRLHTRSGLDWTDRYRGVPEALDQLNCANALIDGEIVTARDVSSGSRFSALQQDLENGTPVLLFAFDLLVLDGKDLRRLPLVERKAKLAALLADLPGNGAQRLTEYATGNGGSVLKAITKTGGEGIVSKRVNSVYRGTRSGAWIKVKSNKRQEFVIGGYTRSSSPGRRFASLLVGTIEKGKFIYRGKVGTGYDMATMEALADRFKPIVRKTPAFESVPASVAKNTVWLSPVLVAEIAFAELTDDGILRHAVFHGLREDKKAGVVKLELPEKASR